MMFGKDNNHDCVILDGDLDKTGGLESENVRGVRESKILKET